jgi:RimJ/RimL family protein N-acetyltransferase
MSLSLEVETPRLVLRQWRAADREPFAALNQDPRVAEYLLPLNAQESDALADRLAAGIDEHGWGFWAVEAPGVAPFIGFVGIKRLAPGAAALGQGLRQRSRRGGLARGVRAGGTG